MMERRATSMGRAGVRERGRPAHAMAVSPPAAAKPAPTARKFAPLLAAVWKQGGVFAPLFGAPVKAFNNSLKVLTGPYNKGVASFTRADSPFNTGANQLKRGANSLNKGVGSFNRVCSAPTLVCNFLGPLPQVFSAFPALAFKEPRSLLRPSVSP